MEGPVRRRYLVLDLLRGFALLGIILANFPEFSLWTFQTEQTLADMPSAGMDRAVQWLHAIFVDGKFYTLFSLLFGIGFYIIISNCMERGTNGKRVFYRRMAVLVAIGSIHLMLLWSGDILLLYALIGMLLPLFWRCTDKGLMRWAFFFLLLSVGVDIFRSLRGFTLALFPYEAWWTKCGEYGITEENFGTWLRDSTSYVGVHQFLMQGSWERLWEFVDGNRYFKVLGLFLVGMYVGRCRLYAQLEEKKKLIRRVFLVGMAVGLPLSIVYAWSSICGHPWGIVAHTLLYTSSVYPLGFAYAAGMALLFFRRQHLWLWKAMAMPGKMALTNYLMHSVFGILLFYGVGLGMGASVSLAATEMLAIAVYATLLVLSGLWMRFFRFGPVEWIWRMLTYGRVFSIRK